MNVFQKHAATLAACVDYLARRGDPVPTFTWAGADYRCIFSRHDQHYLNAGGFTPMDDLTLEPLDPLPDPGPQIEDTILLQNFDGQAGSAKTFRVRTLKRAAGKPPQLICYDPNRGT